MRVDRHFGGLLRPLLLIACALAGFCGCKVYTINKSELETKLKPNGRARSLSIGNIYRRQFRNDIDTLWCVNETTGEVRAKSLTPDSKIWIVTKDNRVIKFYAKSLYIYKDQFLIGERTAPKLYGPNYFPIRLSDIEKVQVNTIWF